MTTETSGNSIQVLLVEGNAEAAKATENTIMQSEHPANVTVAEDGEVAISMLHKEGEYEDAPRPDLILLNLRLPKKDGPEVLAEINQDPDISNIPIVILTASEGEQSLLNSYNVPPSRSWRKPIPLDRFDIAVRQLSTLANQPISLDTPEQQSELVGAGVSGNESEKKKWWWPF